jgi:hypothetical protein
MQFLISLIEYLDTKLELTFKKKKSLTLMITSKLRLINLNKHHN